MSCNSACICENHFKKQSVSYCLIDFLVVGTLLDGFSEWKSQFYDILNKNLRGTAALRSYKTVQLAIFYSY